MSTTPKPFVFVLMPFNPTFDDIYLFGIKAASVEAGAYCERVDEQIFDESILERIYNQIVKADLIVADMTERNPNVFYEVGYAHALGKRVVLITQRSDDIPFDLKHYPHIIYGGKISALKEELTKRIRWVIENPRQDIAESSPSIEIWSGGIRVEESKIVAVQHRFIDAKLGWANQIQLDVHNTSKFPVRGDRVQIALVLKEVGRNDSKRPVVQLPGENYLHTFPIFSVILPGSWASLSLVFTEGYDRFRVGVESSLRVSTELGTRSFEVMARLHPIEERMLDFGDDPL